MPTNPIVPSYTVLIIVFILLFLGFLYFLRRRSRASRIAVPQAAASARQSMRAVKQILVPTAGTEYSERAVELACRMGEDQQAKIHLMHVIVIPRSQPIGTPQPEEEGKAKEALNRARSIVQSHGLESETWVERARTAGEGILVRAKALAPDVIVVGMRPAYDPGASLLDRTTHAILREAPCEIIIDMMPDGREQ
ncbi:MAG: universal stress protein [Armatimonadetes bacterium]|nr:universal stress protein [Armatimonadota bacterium]